VSSRPLAPPLSFRVYLEDTDAGGIVYHATYLRWMERARTEALRLAGMEQSQSFKTDVAFVLHSMNLRFSAPAALDEQIAVSCDLTSRSGATLTFRQQVTSVERGTVHCTAEVVVACISLQTKRPRRIPSELADRLSLSD
jgi:tol-pal system-associated acyl-CoA thioesterase